MPVNEASLKQLHDPTPPDEIKTRKVYVGGGRVKVVDGKEVELSYIDARYVFDTLDRVCGPENWQTAFQGTDAADGVRAGVGIYVERESYDPVGDKPITYGEWVWKWDVGTDSTIEPTKGQHSDAIKRAAVQWGIARDLYGKQEEPPSVPGEDDGEAPPTAIRGATAAPKPATSPTSSTASGGSTSGGGSSGKPWYAEAPDGTPTGVELDPLTTPWSCPTHDTVKLVSPGTNKTSGKSYPAFYGCTERSCRERGVSFEPTWWPPR